MRSELAGKIAPPELLIDVDLLHRDYYSKYPDMNQFGQRVQFGTSGHRGTSFQGTFTQAHVRAIVQSIVDYRLMVGAPEILYVGMDTHVISVAAQRTALEVLAANGVETRYQKDNRYTPTPVISHRIVDLNHYIGANYSDGLIITPSHNPPGDGGIKYNPPHGGPAGSEATQWMQRRANEYLENGNRGVKFIPHDEPFCHIPHFQTIDFRLDYICDLINVIDMEAIRGSGLRLGVDPLGGASIDYWEMIGKLYGLDLTVVNKAVDPTFSFVPLDHDGKIRMDCSSPWSMSGLVRLKDDFDLAFGNDPDADRHGIVSKAAGLMNPNHFLAVAIDYLLQNRSEWSVDKGIGKTLVSSSMIDRVVAGHGRKLIEVPVGFKWFVSGLTDGTIAFGGEESAGASFLRLGGQPWTTDKDGIIMALLAAEIFAKTGKDPGVYYQELVARYGNPIYRRIDQPILPEKKESFSRLTPEQISADFLAGEPILAKLTNAPGNQAAIGGLKVVTENGWFAARSSGTENIYKIYAESFHGEQHLEMILQEATAMVNKAIS